MNKQILKEELEDWCSQLSISIVDMDIPLDDQVEYLFKKYDMTIEEFEIEEYCPVDDKVKKTQKDFLLFRFKDVVIKYRPHLHMGDYWLRLDPDDGSVKYLFLKLVKYTDFERFEIANHPHLSNGVPCFGSHQGDISTSLNDGNFIRFFSQMKLYLSSYYGRSTYLAGKYFKKTTIPYRLHNATEIREIFEVYEDENFDLHGVATDPTRWNFPKEIVPFGNFELESKDRYNFFQFLKVSNIFTGTRAREDGYFPYLSDNAFNSRMFENTDNGWDPRNERCMIKKIMGYVYLAHTLGEMEPLHAAEFVRIFLYKLYKEYCGELNDDVLRKLEKMSSKLNEFVSGGSWKVNSRYTVQFSEEDLKEKQELKHKVGEQGNNANKFAELLKYSGNKMSNFMILIRKKAPHKAQFSTYMNGKPLTTSFEDTFKRYDRLEKKAYLKAMNILEKDRRRFINELNKHNIVNIKDNDEQGSLFSQDV